MKKLLVTSVLLVCTHLGFCQIGCRQVSGEPDNTGLETFLSVEGEKHVIRSKCYEIFEVGRFEDDCQIENSGLDSGYSDLMNLYKGRSLQLVKDIDSGRLFWSPSQSVLDKPFENNVFS
jgi:hypothetical protein